MKRLTLLSATAVALALPASALAATTSGTVLSVSSSHHTIQVVDSARVVHAFSYRGHLAKVHTGTVVSYRRDGSVISGIKVARSTRTVSYFASVVRTSDHRLMLRLADGHTVSFASHQVKSPGRRQHSVEAIAHAASVAPVTINIEGLAAGTTVLVTETVASDGSITISITLPSGVTGGGSGAGGGSAGGGTPGGSGTATPANDETVSGVVSDVEDTTFTITADDGSSIVFQMNADALANVDMFPCDTVIVSYHRDAGQLVADSVNDNGTSDTGACADSDGTSDNSSDETGPITAISSTSVTIDTSDQGSMSFAIDPSLGLTEGFVIGDDVDVTYSPDPDGANDASDIEYVESDSTGTVTSVSDGSISLTDDSTGRTDTFTADPIEQMFAGIAVGDEVDITYHAAGGQTVVDNADDLTADAAAGGDGGDAGDGGSD